MRDDDKTRKQLIEELDQLRQRLAELEAPGYLLKGAEGECKESEAMYQQIVENIPIGICAFDLIKFRFNQVNGVMCETLGYTEEELLSMDPMALFVGDSKQHFKERIKKIKAGENFPRGFEYQMKTKDGREIRVHAMSRIIHENGKPARTLTLTQDISERKRLEQQIRQLQKIELISTLAGGIAHEFNNALMRLSGSLELLQIRSPKSEKVRKYAEITKNSVQRMVQLTDQLLAYARGGKYQSKTLNMTEFVRDTLPLVGHRIKPTVYIETDLPLDSWNINGDPTQLQMVISSIVHNASEAIAGEGRIRVVVRNEEIDKEFAKNYPGLIPGSYVSLAIEDDGIGMDEDTSSKIFEPFFTTKLKGRGLSMSAVYGIVKNHAGFIYVESEPGKGTVVRIYLPPTRARLRKEKLTGKETPLKGKGTILIIDDEKIIRQSTSGMLADLGYQVLEANTGEEAVKIARDFDAPIDLALLNIILPDKGGRDIYPLLMQERPDLKVIVCSGYALNGPAMEVLDAGAQSFLQKPFSMLTLSRKIKEVLTGT